MKKIIFVLMIVVFAATSLFAYSVVNEYNVTGWTSGIHQMDTITIAPWPTFTANVHYGIAIASTAQDVYAKCMVEKSGVVLLQTPTIYPGQNDYQMGTFPATTVHNAVFHQAIGIGRRPSGWVGFKLEVY